MKIVMPTAAEAREQMTKNLASEAEKELNILAIQINEASKNRRGSLVTNLKDINPIVQTELKKLGYVLQYSREHGCWIIHWADFLKWIAENVAD